MLRDWPATKLTPCMMEYKRRPILSNIIKSSNCRCGRRKKTPREGLRPKSPAPTPLFFQVRVQAFALLKQQQVLVFVVLKGCGFLFSVTSFAPF